MSEQRSIFLVLSAATLTLVFTLISGLKLWEAAAGTQASTLNAVRCEQLVASIQRHRGSLSSTDVENEVQTIDNAKVTRLAIEAGIEPNHLLGIRRAARRPIGQTQQFRESMTIELRDVSLENVLRLATLLEGNDGLRVSGVSLSNSNRGRTATNPALERWGVRLTLTWLGAGDTSDLVQTGSGSPLFRTISSSSNAPVLGFVHANPVANDDLLASDVWGFDRRGVSFRANPRVQSNP